MPMFTSKQRDDDDSQNKRIALHCRQCTLSQAWPIPREKTKTKNPSNPSKVRSRKVQTTWTTSFSSNQTRRKTKRKIIVENVSRVSKTSAPRCGKVAPQCHDYSRVHLRTLKYSNVANNTSGGQGDRNKLLNFTQHKNRTSHNNKADARTTNTSIENCGKTPRQKRERSATDWGYGERVVEAAGR
jgi:hypothetical protein